MELIPEESNTQNEFVFDGAILNNVGSIIKIRDIRLYIEPDEQNDDETIKNKLSYEFGYGGVGTHYVYPRDSKLKIGDEISKDIEPIHTVTITVFSSSAFNKSDIKSNWIPVAAVGQSTTLLNGKKVYVSETALKSNLDSWKGGYINVNHAINGKIDDFVIEDAKFENDLLYFKASNKLTEFIENTASSGRSIEFMIQEIDDDGKIELYTGLGLSVLYPPLTPSCTADMGCSSSNLNTEHKGTVRTIFSQLADKLKSQSFMDSMTETTGTDPNLEKTMTEDTDKLTFAKMEAEKDRDEALKDLETLKFSLVEKDTALVEKDGIISNKDTLITEQTGLLKSFQDAEVAAAENVKEDQWDILKSNIPVGMMHKEEDVAVLKQEFLDDPAAFSVKLMSWQKEGARGKSGAEFTEAGDGNGTTTGVYTPGKGYEVV